MVEKHSQTGGVATLEVGRKFGTCLSWRHFDVLGCRFRWRRETEKTLRKGMGSWWRGGCIFRSKSVLLTTKCHRVVCHAVSTAFNGSINKKMAGEDRLDNRRMSSWLMPVEWKNLNVAVDGRKMAPIG